MNDDTTSARSIHHGLTYRRGSPEVIKVALNGSKPLPSSNVDSKFALIKTGIDRQQDRVMWVARMTPFCIFRDQRLFKFSLTRARQEIRPRERGRRGYVKILTISGEEGLKRDKREAGPRRRRTGDRQAARRSAASQKSTKVQDVSLVLIRARWGLRSLMGSQCGLEYCQKYCGNFRRAIFDTLITQPRRNIYGPRKEQREEGKTA